MGKYFRKVMVFGAVTVFIIAGIRLEAKADNRELLHNTASMIDDTGISAHMILISDSHTSLTISKEGKVTVSVSVTGSASTTKCKIVATLQKSVNGTWKKIKSWKKLNNSKTARVSKTYTVSKGTYRISAKITAYSESGSETKTITSGSRTY